MTRNIVVLLIWTLFLLGVLFAPIGDSVVPEAVRFQHFDKVAHFCLFAVTAFVGVFGISTRVPLPLRFLLGAFFALFLGALTEYLQSLLPFRQMSPYDFMADLIGVGAGLAFYAILHSLYPIRALLKL